MQKIFNVFLVFSVATAIHGAEPLSALAASEQIGLAVIVRNDVSQIEPSVSKILQADDLVRDEVVQTLADSNAKFVLKDSTNLMLSPNARLKLDRAVFSGDNNWRYRTKAGCRFFSLRNGKLCQRVLFDLHADRHDERPRYNPRFPD